MIQCVDCSADHRGAMYMVHNSLWLTAGYGPADLACLSCLARRIGREVGLGDLTGAPINDELRVRLGGSLSPDRAALRVIAAAMDLPADDALDAIALALEEAGIRLCPDADLDADL